MFISWPTIDDDIHMDKSMYPKDIKSIYDDDVMDFPMVQKGILMFYVWKIYLEHNNWS